MAGDNFSSWSLCSQWRQASTFSSGSSCSKMATSGRLSVSQSRAAPASPSAPVLTHTSPCSQRNLVSSTDVGHCSLSRFPYSSYSLDMPVKTVLFDQRVRMLHDFGSSLTNYVHLVQPPRTVYSPRSMMCPHEGVIQRLSPHSLRATHVVVAQHLRCTQAQQQRGLPQVLLAGSTALTRFAHANP